MQNIPRFQGDSGGPLTIEKNGIHTLMGITSHGFSTNYVKVEFKQTGIPHTTSILTMIIRESSKQTMILILCGKRKFENIESLVPFTIWYEETFYMLKIGLKNDKDGPSGSQLNSEHLWIAKTFCQSNLLHPKVTKSFGYCIFSTKLQKNYPK